MKRDTSLPKKAAKATPVLDRAVRRVIVYRPPPKRGRVVESTR